MKTLTTSLRARRASASHLAAFAGSIFGAAPVMAQPSFQALPLLPGMQELRPIGVVGMGDDVVIPFKAIKEEGVQVYEAAGVWKGGQSFLAPNPIGPGGEPQSLVNMQFRSMPPRESGARLGQTIPGIDIIVKRTPVGKAAYWDTRGSDTGEIVDLGDSFGALSSWPNSLNADGSLISGAIYGDFDGMGETRYAVQWSGGGSASLMPVPAGAQHSEAFATSLNGTSVGCFKAIREQGVQRSDPRLIPMMGAQGIVWHPGGGYTVVPASAAGPDAVSIVLTGITDDAQFALAAFSTTRWLAKGGLARVSTGDVITLDGGDINHDGVIDLLDDHDSTVNGVAWNAGIAVGSLTITPGQEEAAVWLWANSPLGVAAPDRVLGLREYMDELGLPATPGWTFRSITGVSTDGQTLAGWGINPLGQTAGFVITVPTPGALVLAGVSGLVLARRRR